MTLGTIYIIIYYTHEDSFHIMTNSSPIARCPPVSSTWIGLEWGHLCGNCRWRFSLESFADMLAGCVFLGNLRRALDIWRHETIIASSATSNSNLETEKNDRLGEISPICYQTGISCLVNSFQLVPAFLLASCPPPALGHSPPYPEHTRKQSAQSRDQHKLKSD